MLNSIILDYIT